MGYTECHHIIPKSMGGSNDKENLVRLTAREHFVCHRLLTKMTEGKDRYRMINAVWRMCTSKVHLISSHTYEYARKQNAERVSKTSTGAKRAPFSDQARKNISEGHKGLKLVISEKGLEGKRRGSEKRKGRPTWNKGKKEPYSPETLAKMSENFSKRMKGVPKIKKPCKHCGKLVAPNMIERFHNNNCKLRS